MSAKALGVEVWAISRSRAKEADARKIFHYFMGTTHLGSRKEMLEMFDLVASKVLNLGLRRSLFQVKA